jgi:hypothetical protein
LKASDHFVRQGSKIILCIGKTLISSFFTKLRSFQALSPTPSFLMLFCIAIQRGCKITAHALSKHCPLGFEAHCGDGENASAVILHNVAVTSSASCSPVHGFLRLLVFPFNGNGKNHTRLFQTLSVRVRSPLWPGENSTAVILHKVVVILCVCSRR